MVCGDIVKLMFNNQFCGLYRISHRLSISSNALDAQRFVGRGNNIRIICRSTHTLTSKTNTAAALGALFA